jgi:hypothetical protein
MQPVLASSQNSIFSNRRCNGTGHFKNDNNYWNTNSYSYLETSGAQSSNVYLNVVHFFNASVRHLWQLKTVVFLHWCLIHTESRIACVNMVKRLTCNGIFPKLLLRIVVEVVVEKEERRQLLSIVWGPLVKAARSLVAMHVHLKQTF